jgi:hypothetical protein
MILRAGFFALAFIAVLTAADYKDVNRTVSLIPLLSKTLIDPWVGVNGSG